MTSCNSRNVPIPPITGPIDLLDYLLQSDDPNHEWTLGGFDTHLCPDPDGTSTPCFVMHKYSEAGRYELYKFTPTEIQLRYEVWREDPKSEDQSWIRRFEEITADNPAPGALWCPRFMTPGGPGTLSHFRQDRFVFNKSTHNYDFDAGGSTPDMQTWLSINYAVNDWARNNQTGMKLNPVIRLTSQWQREGLIFETYDYAKGKSLVAWRWYERLNALKPMQGDQTGKIFHCENGYVSIESQTPPIVYQYDPARHRKGRRLETIQFTSHWHPESGPQTYVIYRDTTKEYPLKLRHENLPVDFTLPEWTAKPNATLKDLPYHNTHAPN